MVSWFLLWLDLLPFSSANLREKAISTSNALSLHEHSDTWKTWTPSFRKLAKVVPTVFLYPTSFITLTIRVSCINLVLPWESCHRSVYRPAELNEYPFRWPNPLKVCIQWPPAGPFLNRVSSTWFEGYRIFEVIFMVEAALDDMCVYENVTGWSHDPRASENILLRDYKDKDQWI